MQWANRHWLEKKSPHLYVHLNVMFSFKQCLVVKDLLTMKSHFRFIVTAWAADSQKSCLMDLFGLLFFINNVFRCHRTISTTYQSRHLRDWKRCYIFNRTFWLFCFFVTYFVVWILKKTLAEKKAGHAKICCFGHSCMTRVICVWVENQTYLLECI